MVTTFKTRKLTLSTQINVKLTFIRKLQHITDMRSINDISNVFGGRRYVVLTLGKVDWRRRRLNSKVSP